MPTKKTTIISRSQFKTLCVQAVKQLKGIRISEQAIRYLRLSMNETVATVTHLSEALSVVFKALQQRGVKSVGVEDIRDWITPTRAEGTEVPSDRGDEAEFVADGNLAEDALHNVRRVLERKRVKNDDGMWMTYFLVDWEPTWEPTKNLSQTLIANFSKQNKALVRKVYIEYEAKVDNSTNPQ